MKKELLKRLEELKKQDADSYFVGNIGGDLDRRLKMDKIVELLWVFED